MAMYNAKKFQKIIDIDVKDNDITPKVLNIKKKKVIYDVNNNNVKITEKFVKIEVKEFNLSQKKTLIKNVENIKVFERKLNMQIKKSFDPAQKLNEKYLIKSAGNHLYESGLSFYQFIPGRNRKAFFNPYWVFFVYLIITLRSVLSLILSNEDDQVHIYLGDYTHFLNAKFFINPALILSIIIMLLTQLIHFIDYKRGVKPEYLKPLGMLSGMYSPEEVGLTNEKDIRLLSRMLKWGQLYGVVAILNTTLLSIIVIFIPLLFASKWYEIILFAIPWSIISDISVFYLTNHYVFNSLYFLVICVYFKLKLKHLNNEIENRIKMKSRKFDEIHKLLKLLDSVHSEISKHNNLYWSKFNFLFCAMISIIVNLYLFQSFFGEMLWFLRIIFLYLTLIMTVLMTFYLKTNAIVFNEANKAFKSLTKLYIEYNQWSLSMTLRLKVL